MSAPPVPPRPYDADRQYSMPPPVPPLPPDLRYQEDRYQEDRYTGGSSYESPPHFDNPLAAPRPHRFDPSIPQNMARTLDDQLYTPPPAGNVNYAPGFAIPNPARGVTPLPPPQGANWTPWAAAAQTQSYSSPSSSNSQQSLPYPADLSQTMANLTFSNAPAPRPQQQRRPSGHAVAPPAAKPPSPSRNANPPSLTAPLPTLAHLQGALQVVQQPSHDPSLKIAWCRDVFFLVDRAQQIPAPTTDLSSGPVIISDPQLERLARVAVPIVLQLASITATPMPAYVAEAVYMRANFTASGAYPDFVSQNPRTAFRDFEAAARAGYAGAWFKLGRDYESFNDNAHAKDCFERGVKLGVESCTYRMGMAHLLGQLSLPSSPELAIPLLHRAATLASLEVPQPAYVYALLLLSEFSQVTVPPSLFAPYIPPSSSPTLEARKHLERAAYLHFAPAQFKLGHAYESAQPPFPFDPLLSVQYYSLASQQGDIEADMALSKWFLCGSSGAGGDDTSGGFEKDETLAWTFADKAARKGLPSAEFAMGYYAEVGVGGPKDLQTAIRWYTMAKDHGNNDAAERLAALSQPSPQALSRQEHNNITESKLVRTRTQAKQRSEAQPLSPPYNGQTFPHHAQTMPYESGRSNGKQVIENIRRNSQSSFPPSSQQPYQGGAGRLGAVQEFSPPPKTSSPQSIPSNPQSGSPSMRPQQLQQKYPASAHRYTRSDAPVQSLPSNSRPSGRTQSPARPGAGRPGAGQPAGRHGRMASQGTGLSLPDGGPVPNTALPTPKPAATPGKPTTFAEMGFQGAKAEDKECVIM